MPYKPNKHLQCLQVLVGIFLTRMKLMWYWFSSTTGVTFRPERCGEATLDKDEAVCTFKADSRRPTKWKVRLVKMAETDIKVEDTLATGLLQNSFCLQLSSRLWASKSRSPFNRAGSVGRSLSPLFPFLRSFGPCFFSSFLRSFILPYIHPQDPIRTASEGENDPPRVPLSAISLT